VQADLEVYLVGDTVPRSDEYILVDEDGNVQDDEALFMEEGIKFPKVPREGLFYMLNPF
jgi:hypothetical protein